MSESNTKTKKASLFSRIKRYFKETKSELKKVTWPSMAQIKKNTGVIIVFIILVAIFLFICYMAFGGLRQVFINIF